jgi:exodeoxyribonuclease III
MVQSSCDVKLSLPQACCKATGKMKITTFNVNGIRAALNKGLMEWAQFERPDVLCLQEIKARPEQLSPDLRAWPGYHSYWYPADRPGYSGVATFARFVPSSFHAGLGEARFDSEGRIIRTKFPDYYLYNVYFPNGQRGHDRVEYKLEFYASLLNEIDQRHAAGENVIITGDFNTAHCEIDLANPKSNSKTSGFLPEERAWIDIYLQHNLVDAYRSLYPGRIQYTWWTFITNARARNIGWRLDYFLVSKPLMDRVKDVIIHDEVPGSDHCPVSLHID